VNFFKTISIAILLCLSASSPAQSLSDQIPDLGQPENRYFSANLQNIYGRLVYSEFYKQPAFVHDPIVDEYINDLGFKLFSHVTDSRHIPRFFVVRQNSINAFAYPGGTIGFHTGLITETQTESELAGVMAHELSHVSQNHIARSIQNSAKQAPLQLLATLVTVIAASSSGDGNAIAGSLAITQGLFAQQSINFTRSQETEADQVGIQLMEKSGFNVNGFRDFFSRLQKSYSDERAVKIPELLRSHPKPSSRIAETNARITVDNTQVIKNSFAYEVVRAIVFESLPKNERPSVDKIVYSPEGRQFHNSLRAYHDNPANGIQIMQKLSETSFDPYVHFKLAEMQLNNGQSSQAQTTVNNALLLFPKNNLLSLFKAERLLESGQSKDVITLLENLQDSSSHPRIPALLAKAYENNNNFPEAYYQLANHYYAIGNFYQALYQLDNAQAYPDLSKEQKARLKQKYESIYHELPDDLRDDLIKSNRRRDQRY